MLKKIIFQLAFGIALLIPNVQSSDPNENDIPKKPTLLPNKITQINPQEKTPLCDRLPVIRNYRDFLKQPSSFFPGMCKGTTIGAGTTFLSVYLLFTDRNIPYKTELTAFSLFFGPATVYLSPQTSPLLKHALTGALSSAGTIGIAAAGTTIVGTVGFLILALNLWNK